MLYTYVVLHTPKYRYTKQKFPSNISCEEEEKRNTKKETQRRRSEIVRGKREIERKRESNISKLMKEKQSFCRSRY